MNCDGHNQQQDPSPALPLLLLRSAEGLNCIKPIESNIGRKLIWYIVNKGFIYWSKNPSHPEDDSFPACPDMPKFTLHAPFLALCLPLLNFFYPLNFNFPFPSVFSQNRLIFPSKGREDTVFYNIYTTVIECEIVLDYNEWLRRNLRFPAV